MSINKKLKWKRALSRLRFCYDELEYTKESANEAAGEFEEHYRRFCAEKNINISELEGKNRDRLEKLYGNNEITDNSADDQPNINSASDSAIVVHNAPLEANEEYQMTADDIAMHDSFSKLFKKLALKLHPDRIDKLLPDDEREMRVNMFQEANRAFEDKKYYILLDLADRYNITTPHNYDLQARWMKKESQRVVRLVDKEKNTYNYSFAEAETEEEKERLIKKFIFQLFRVVI